jgi:hypothetical protein
MQSPQMKYATCSGSAKRRHSFSDSHGRRSAPRRAFLNEWVTAFALEISLLFRTILNQFRLVAGHSPQHDFLHHAPPIEEALCSPIGGNVSLRVATPDSSRTTLLVTAQF